MHVLRALQGKPAAATMMLLEQIPHAMQQRAAKMSMWHLMRVMRAPMGQQALAATMPPDRTPAVKRRKHIHLILSAARLRTRALVGLKPLAVNQIAKTLQAQWDFHMWSQEAGVEALVGVTMRTEMVMSITTAPLARGPPGDLLSVARPTRLYPTLRAA